MANPPPPANDPFAPRRIAGKPPAPPSEPIDQNKEDEIMRNIASELSSISDPQPPQKRAHRDDLDELPEPKSYAGNIDPVISGLLTHLPTPGSVWSMDARKLWLQIIEGAFDMIYKKAPEPEQQRNNNDPHGTALQDQ